MENRYEMRKWNGLWKWNGTGMDDWVLDNEDV
jgi:hypothetical protein